MGFLDLLLRRPKSRKSSDPALDRSSNHYAEALHRGSPTAPLTPKDTVRHREGQNQSIYSKKEILFLV